MKQNNNYTVIYQYVDEKLTQNNCTASDVKVFSKLYTYGEKGYNFSLKILSKILCLSIRQVSRSLNKLINMKLITKEKPQEKKEYGYNYNIYKTNIQELEKLKTVEVDYYTEQDINRDYNLCKEEHIAIENEEKEIIKNLDENQEEKEIIENKQENITKEQYDFQTRTLTSHNGDYYTIHTVQELEEILKKVDNHIEIQENNKNNNDNKQKQEKEQLTIDKAMIHDKKTDPLLYLSDKVFWFFYKKKNYIIQNRAKAMINISDTIQAVNKQNSCDAIERIDKVLDFLINDNQYYPNKQQEIIEKINNTYYFRENFLLLEQMSKKYTYNDDSIMEERKRYLEQYENTKNT